MKLETDADVMRAFLDGKKLINSSYHDKTGEMYLYLEKSGYIAEEDGAGAKSYRVPLPMHTENDWWEMIEEQA